MQTNNCPCDLPALIRDRWADCPELTDLMPAEQLAVDEHNGDPTAPFGVIEEQNGTLLSCNSNGDLFQVPLFITFRCFKRKELATQIRKLVYRKFHRKLTGAATGCGVVCDFYFNLPNVKEVGYNYVVRFQATVKLSVSL